MRFLSFDTSTAALSVQNVPTEPIVEGNGISNGWFGLNSVLKFYEMDEASIAELGITGSVYTHLVSVTCNPSPY